MNFQRLGAWFLKDSGQKFVFGTAVATAAGLACLHILPHTFLIDKYKDVIHFYKHGYALPVSQALQNRFDKTLELLGINEAHKKQFLPFMVIGFDIFSVGTFYSRYGVAIGLPINFTYVDADFIDKSGIKIMDNSVPWETEEGKLLLKSLILSEKAQMYAMAREIQIRQTPKYFIDLFSSVTAFIVAYGVGNNLNTKFNLYTKPRPVRFIMYGLLGCFALSNYIFITDFTQLYYEKQIDEYLKNKNKIFKEGGKEFYESTLNRNIAFRKLMGKVGESNYTSLGNENYMIRQKHLPLLQRKDFFESM